MSNSERGQQSIKFRPFSPSVSRPKDRSSPSQHHGKLRPPAVRGYLFDTLSWCEVSLRGIKMFLNHDHGL